MMEDQGYPTCGSKNFGNIQMRKNQDTTVTWKKQCYNCKKFWHAES